MNLAYKTCNIPAPATMSTYFSISEAATIEQTYIHR